MASKKQSHDLTDVETEFLECRDFGHAWSWTTDQHVVFGARNKPIEFVRVLLCTRCETSREQTIDLTTWAPSKGNRYHYPDGYIVSSPAGKLHRRDFRQELIMRIITTNAKRGRKRSG